MIKPTCPNEAFPRIRLGVSACLLGQPVRYDGGHKEHTFLTGILAGYVEFLPVCPEAGIGMGVPRPPIHLVGDRQRPHALGVEDASLDVTAALEAFAAATLTELDDVSGYIFKTNSPSCGLRQVKVFARPGQRPRRQATGVFARVVTSALPLLPVMEEDGLDDAQQRENFICRVYVYHRWQALQAHGLNAADLLHFHAAHRHLVMSHSQASCRRLEKLLSGLSAERLPHTADVYIREVMATLARPSRRAQHYKVLTHLAGCLDQRMNSRQRATLATRLAAYHDGGLSLGETIATVRHLFEHHRHPDSDKPLYLYPYPDGLGLRNAL
jgi:uncharacterized protein YbbK (DUF523 family)/uncharacterized protein YbgA (DUF1722 family)